MVSIIVSIYTERPHKINFNYLVSVWTRYFAQDFLYINTYPSKIHFLIYMLLYCYRWRCWHHFIHISLTLWSGKTQAVLLFEEEKKRQQICCEFKAFTQPQSCVLHIRQLFLPLHFQTHNKTAQTCARK